jgi:uroporphyrinogen decarboxylase
MGPRERVLKALKRGQPDKVPFMDVVDSRMQSQIMGRASFDQLELVQKMQFDSLMYEAYPPFFVEKAVNDNGREIITAGAIRTRADLALVKMPTLDVTFIDNMKRFVDKYGGSGYALYYRTRMGCAGVLNSMGLDNFSYALLDDPKLVDMLMCIYAEWVIELLEKTQGIGFDFLWFSDDLAYKSGPMFAPQVFRDVFLPPMREICRHIQLPWVFHSDGDLMPIIEDLLSLGMDGLNPIEPGPMDINLLKERYGKRICLLGNIDLHRTLTQGTTKEVEEEVRQRIESVGKGGGYIIASSNSITDYCKLENVFAFRDAVLKYRAY